MPAALNRAMLRAMQHLALAASLLAVIALAGCGDDRPAPTHAESGAAHMRASGEAEKSFDKENPANPGEFSEKK